MEGNKGRGLPKAIPFDSMLLGLVRSHAMNAAFSDHFSTVVSGSADCRPRYPVKLFDYLAAQVSSNAVVWDGAVWNGQAHQGDKDAKGTHGSRLGSGRLMSKPQTGAMYVGYLKGVESGRLANAGE